MFNRRTLLYGVTALALLALVVTAGKGGKPKPPPEPPPAADPAILYSTAQNGIYEIWAMNEDGSNQTPLITMGTHGLSATEPSWSSDNTRFVFRVLNDGLYVSDLDGSNVERILAKGELHYGGVNPDWSPAPLPGQPEDDEWIFFNDDTGGERDIFAIRSDGTGLVNLTSTPYRWEGHQSVSFDGTFIAYTAWTDSANGGDEQHRVYVGTLGTDEFGDPVITDETCLTDVEGSPLVSLNCVVPRIDPTGTYVAIRTPQSTTSASPQGWWLVPLADPSAASRTPTSGSASSASVVHAWLDDESVVYMAYARRNSSLAKTNIFTGGEETILATSGRGYAFASIATRR